MMLEEGRFAVIHPGAARPERILEVDKWASVARELVACRAVERIVISAGPGGAERIMAEALCGLIGPVAMSTGGRLRFSQLARLIKESRLFLGADSSVLQLAAAVGTPAQVREQVAAFVARTGADEILLCGATYDAAARIRSLELTLEACETVLAA